MIGHLSQTLGKMKENQINMHWPKMEFPAGFEDAESYLRHLVEEGAKRRYGDIDSLVAARVDEELCRFKGFEPYFLVLHDLVEFCKGKNIFVSVLFRSATCSIVNYCLGITTVDPILNGLSFELFFLNTDKDSPYFRLMVNMDDLGLVIYHLEKKYGFGCVSKVYDGYKDYKTYYGDFIRVPSVDSSCIFFFDKPFQEAVGAISVEGGFFYPEEEIPKYSKEILDELGYMHIDFCLYYDSDDIIDDLSC